MTAWRLWLAMVAVASACRPALAEGGKTVLGRCLAIVDGMTEGTSACSIDVAAGGGFSFEAWSQDSAMPFGRRIVHLVPDKATHPVVRPQRMAHPFGRVGPQMSLECTDSPHSQGGASECVGARGAASMVDPDGAGGSDAAIPLGTLKQQGACWVGDRATLCAWDGEAEMRRNRTAPYTAFHTLLGRNLRARCQMGECEWLRYDRATVVTHDAHEVVLKIDGQFWTTYSPDYDYNRPRKKEQVTRNPLYFWCSHTRPAEMTRQRGKGWTLSPYRPDGDDGLSGAFQYTYTTYAAACDGLDHVIATDEGRLLGYDTASNHDEGDVHVDGLTDALKGSSRSHGTGR